MFAASADIAAAMKGVTVAPAGIKSLGLAVSSGKSGPEETPGKGEQKQAEKGLSPPHPGILWIGEHSPLDH